MRENCLRYWLDDNVLEGDLEFNVCVFDFESDETVYEGPIGEIPDDIMEATFCSIEFQSIGTTVIFNVEM